MFLKNISLLLSKGIESEEDNTSVNVNENNGANQLQICVVWSTPTIAKLLLRQ